MRIGIDISKAVSPSDGIGYYAYNLTRGLMGLGSAHDFRLHSLSRPLDAVEVSQQFSRLPPNFRLAEQDGYNDLEVFHSLSWDYPHGCRGSVVSTCHDLTFLSHPEFHLPFNKVRCARGIVEAMVNDAHFVCVSRHTQSELLERLRVPRERTTVIYEGACVPRKPSERHLAARRLRRKTEIEGPFLLYVGRLEPRKNLVRLLQAYDGLSEDLRRSTDLVLAGPPGWRDTDLQSYFEQRRDTAGRVLSLGFVSEDIKADLYGAALAFIYPSLAEGFGLPVLEALASGAAVAVSNTTSLPEVAGNDALYFDPLDVADIRSCLQRLLTDESELRRLRAAGPARAAEFSWKKAAQQTLELYESLARE